MFNLTTAVPIKVHWNNSLVSFLALVAFFFFSISPANAAFVRGDVNDDTAIDVSDAVSIVNYLFSASEERPCEDAADANDDGSVDVSDIVYIVYYLFGTGNPPPDPFALRGEDPTEDELGCLRDPEAINECLTDNGGCDLLTECVNTPEGFECGACPEGYSGNGLDGCEEIDDPGPVHKWSKTFGGETGEEAFYVQQTSDGGYIATGFTGSWGNGNADIWLLKTDALGNVSWNRTFGGGDSDLGRAVQETNDGGFILMAHTRSFGGDDNDFWLIKTDANGIEEWSRTFGGEGNDTGRSVRQTDDGGFIMTGTTYSSGGGGADVWLLKTDAQGNKEWEQTFGGSQSEVGNDVVQTADGGYAVIGYQSVSGTQILLLKTDSNGHILWNKNYGGERSDYGFSIAEAADGGFLLTGQTYSYASGSYSGDIMAIKTDALGTEEWTKIFGGTGNEYGFSGQQAQDGGYIIAGYTTSFGNGGADVWLLKTNEHGIAQWNRTYGGAGEDYARSVQATEDGGYIIAGQFDGDDSTWGFNYRTPTQLLLIKTDAEGHTEDIIPGEETQPQSADNTDSNQCLLNTDDCHPVTECINTANGYECGPCPQGYNESRLQGCEDIDECALEDSVCDAHTECINTPGGFQCGECLQGFVKNHLEKCEDVDECAADNGGCDALTQCTNTVGGVECGECPQGYNGNGLQGCEDIDECALDNSVCDVHTECTNTPGGFECGECLQGFAKNHLEECEDMDECAVDNGGCDALTQCTNTPGGFECGECPQGYNGNGAQGCEDMDECAVNNGGCHSLTQCTNTIGGFECGECPEGYNGNGAQGCDDLDECAAGAFVCDPMTQCTNTPGGYECTECPEGYESDGAHGCLQIGEALRWQRTFGGELDEKAHDIQQTSDGGYIIVADKGIAGGDTWTSSDDRTDLMLIKIDALGNQAWEQTFSGGGISTGRSVQQTDDGGYIIAGTKSAFGSPWDAYAWLIKTDAEGNSVWERTYGGGQGETAFSVQQIEEGGYVFTGCTRSYVVGSNCNVWLLKVDANGSPLWDARDQQAGTVWQRPGKGNWGGESGDSGRAVQQTTDGEYIIVGYTRSFGSGNADIYLIKSNAYGVVPGWPTSHGGNPRTFGGSENDYGTSVKQTQDGGYIITGSTESEGNGGTDVILIKVNRHLHTEWTKTFGGSDDDYGASVEQTPEGDFILSGYTESFGSGYKDIWLIKTDDDGNEIWNRTYGGMYSDEATSLSLTDDGGYVLAGSTKSFGNNDSVSSNIWVIKTDANGITDECAIDNGGCDSVAQCILTQEGSVCGPCPEGYEGDPLTGCEDIDECAVDNGGCDEMSECSNTEGSFQCLCPTGYQSDGLTGCESANQLFGGDDSDWIYSMEQTSDGGLIMAGYTKSFGNGGKDLWLLKTDLQGNEEWSQTFGTLSSEEGKSVKETSDGGFIITGHIYTGGENGTDVWLIKTDANGVEEWDQTFGGYNSDYGTSVQETTDGGFIIAGTTKTFGERRECPICRGGYNDEPNVWLIKTDAQGNEEWNQPFGGTAWDVGYSVQQTVDGGYIIVGGTYSYGYGYSQYYVQRNSWRSDIYLIKTDANGIQEWYQTLGGTDWDLARSVQQTSDNGFIIAGYTSSFGTGARKAYLVKTDSQGTQEWDYVFGNSSRGHEANAVKETANGGFIVAGGKQAIGSPGPYRYAFLFKTDASGNEEWSQYYGGTSEWAHDVVQTEEGGYVVAGSLSPQSGGRDAWIFHTDDLGNIQYPATENSAEGE